MKQDLGYGKHAPAGQNSGNSRNGVTRKTLKGDFGELEMATPRERNGDFEPQIVRRTRPAGRVLTTRSCPCMRAVCRRGRFRDTLKKSTRWRSAPT